MAEKIAGWPPRFITPTTAAERERGNGDHAIEFIESYARIVKESVGGKAGDLIVLRPWQKELVRWTLAAGPDGRKKHRQALIGLPRKSGKSAMLSGLALYELLLGPDGGEVYAAASTRDQARIIHSTTKRMIEMDPELMGMTKLFRDAVEVPSTGSVFRVVAAEAPALEGLSPTFVVLDELHTFPDRQLYDVFSLAMAARPDPQLVSITTAGVRFDRNGNDTLCYSMYDYGKRVAAKEVEDNAFGMAWWAPKSETSDYKDPKVWAEANPGYGDLQTVEDFESAVKRTPEAEYRTKRLNLWVVTASAWMPDGVWESCELDFTPPKGAPVVLALDGSFSNDSTAVVGCTIPVHPDEKPHLFVAGAWERPPNADQHWTVDVLDVEARIRECALYWDVKEIAADPFRWQRSLEVLAEDRLPVVVFPQSPTRMSPATSRMYEAAVNNTITQDGNKAFARHVASAVLKTDHRGSRIVKESRASSKRIDIAVCAVMALDRAAYWATEIRKPKARYASF